MDLVIEETFDTNINTLWEAWSTDSIIGKWATPIGFETKEIEGDFKIGGKWKQVMERGPHTMTLEGEYAEIVEPNKIVTSASVLTPDGAASFTSSYIIEFNEEDGKVHMKFTQTKLPNEQGLKMAEMGWKGAFSKLKDIVEK